MDYWNGGMEILKVYCQILHPNKAHVPVSQHINTLYVLNEVSIKNMNKNTLDLTLIYNHIVNC